MHELALMALLLIAPADRAVDKPPPGLPPALWLASASEKDDKVVIQIAKPGVETPPVDGKEKPAALAPKWLNLRKVTLGDTVLAFGVDGESVEAKAVLKALAKPRGVAVFIRSYPDDPTTPPVFYRDLLREGTIILVVNADDIYNAKP